MPAAIRSLQCVDHAENIPPKVLTIQWLLGKRCNYDCSYCPPHLHDSVSPFIRLEQAKNFCNAVDSYCSQQRLQTKWNFTGGEPFIDPGFLALAQYIKSKNTTYQMNVITNGSLPLRIYLQAQTIFDGITVSLHLERSFSEIENTLQKIAAIKDCFVSINLMFLPGRLPEVEKLTHQIQQYHIPYVLKKITPVWTPDQYLPFGRSGTDRKNVRLHDLETQTWQKIMYKQEADSQRQGLIDSYYTETEREVLESNSGKNVWQNCGVWFDDGSYREMNSDNLLASDRVSFTDWICYAGVDSLHVDHDGQIYRASCLNDAAIGHISESSVFCDKPTRCHKKYCICSSEIATRKAKIDFLHYVTE